MLYLSTPHPSSFQSVLPSIGPILALPHIQTFVALVCNRSTPHFASYTGEHLYSIPGRTYDLRPRGKATWHVFIYTTVYKRFMWPLIGLKLRATSLRGICGYSRTLCTRTRGTPAPPDPSGFIPWQCQLIPLVGAEGSKIYATLRNPLRSTLQAMEGLRRSTPGTHLAPT